MFEWFMDLGMGMMHAAQPAVLLAALVGVLIGCVIGVIPGLGPAVAMSLAIPLTFTLPAHVAISLLLGIYKGGTYGGSISAILINTPEPRRQRPPSSTAILWPGKGRRARRCIWPCSLRFSGTPSAFSS